MKIYVRRESYNTRAADANFFVNALSRRQSDPMAQAGVGLRPMPDTPTIIRDDSYQQIY
ncbi:MAG TPA: hypothetical protein VF656_19460 [Pyrinomonadaceae bacterium]